jgi:hypothetical protein
VGQNRCVRWGAILAVAASLTGAACQPFTRPDGAASIPATDETTVRARAAARSARRAVEWVHTARNEVIYLRWTAPDGAVAGVVQTARRDAGGARVSVTSGIIGGAANGSNVVLTNDRETWSGTVVADNLVLAMTRPGGVRAELRFVRGSVAEYDAAVAALRQKVARATTTTTIATKTRRRPRPTATTTVTTQATTPAPQPGPDPNELLSELDAVTSRLRDLGAAESEVGPVEEALDAMYRAADGVYAAVARSKCRNANVRLARLDRDARQVERAVGAVEAAAAAIENQRAVVMEVGMRVVGLDDPGLNPTIVATNDELAHADAAVSELRRYAGEVHAAIATTTTDASRAASGC